MRTILAVAFGAALAMPVASAAADPTFDFSLAPQRVTPGEPINYTITIKTGAEAERFGLAVGPLAGGEVDGRPRWPLVKAGAIEHQGAGTASYSWTSPGAPPACSAFAFSSVRGRYWEGGPSAWLELPPDSTATLKVSGATAGNGSPALVPRIGETYGLRFTTVNSGAGGTGGTLDATGELTAPVAPPADGPRGVWLTAATEPQSQPLGYRGVGGCPAFPVVREPITVRGRTHPALPGQTVLIEGGNRASETPQIIGSAVVRDDGSFSFGPWTPPAAGDYELRAIYRSQTPEFADDQMEGANGFRYEPPAVPPAAAGPSGLQPAARARVRRGVARLRVACPPTAAARCRGTLRLRRGRATWGRRAFDMAPGAAASVRIRLSARARAVLSRRKRVKVELDVKQGAAKRTLTLSLRR